jgi:hypothetical protein
MVLAADTSPATFMVVYRAHAVRPPDAPAAAESFHCWNTLSAGAGSHVVHS